MLQIVNSKKSNILKGATPFGELQWVTISGEGRENFNKDGFIYQANIVLDEKPAKQVVKKIKEYHESFKSDKTQQGGLGYSVGILEKDSNGEPIEKFIRPDTVTSKHKKSGRYSFSFKTNVEFNGKPTIIPVYNSRAKKVTLPDDVSIGNGSLGALQVTYIHAESPAAQYISGYLNGVQITKLVEYEGDNDFEEAEGEFEGYTDSETGFSASDENTDDEPDVDL